MKSQPDVYSRRINTVLCLALIVSVLSTVKAQEPTPKTMVGFACGFAGEASEEVVKITQLLHADRYQKISALLSTGNNAEKFLAVISLEKLSSLGRYQIGDTEKEQIKAIKISLERVSVCSGCTYFSELSLADMFRETNLLGSDHWIASVLD